ncbi:MAG: 4-hydroxy-tetrahydrodipicolinate synthase [Rhodothermales bacterium]
MNERHLFHGTAPALVTPFTPDGEVDEPAFRRLIDDQIAGGVDALVVLGTTGENPTVTPAERSRLVDIGIAHTNRRVPVIIGVGTNHTAESVRFAREARAAGADGLLVVGPYYNKPTPAGVIAHVSAIADATDTPIILYNVPGRTGSNLTADTQLAVAEHVPSVVGLKEASGNLAQISDLLQRRPPHLAVYSGDDELTLPLIALGAEGVISVISNAIPKPFCYMVRAGLAGDYETARRLHFDLLEAMRMCFVESNPVPVKEALAHAGKMNARVRLPLVGLQEANREKVLRAFAPFMKG